MATLLKQSTAATIMMGPFVDEDDGKTAETSLSITQPDIRLSKNGGNFAQKSASQTLSHNENGWYSVSLSTTDTNTLGSLIVAIHEGGALPVWREFMVVPANVYDSLVLGTDQLEIDLVQWRGTQPNTLVSARVDASVGAMASAVLTAAAIASNAITADKINAAALANAKFADGALTAAKFAADAIGSDQLAAAAVAKIWAQAMAEPSAPPAPDDSALEGLAWLVALALNKVLTTSAQMTLRNAADDTDVAIAAVADDGTTFTRGAWDVPE